VGCLVLAFQSPSPTTPQAPSSTYGRRRRGRGTCGGASSCGKVGEKRKEEEQASRLMMALVSRLMLEATSSKQEAVRLKWEVVRWEEFSLCLPPILVVMGN